MTANALEGDRETCIRAGMDDYIAKPISIAGLRVILERWTPAARARVHQDTEPGKLQVADEVV